MATTDETFSFPRAYIIFPASPLTHRRSYARPRPPSSTPQPQLPVELLDKILEEVCTDADVKEGRRTWSAFCLGSRTFASVARRKLYREVVLEFYGFGDVPFQLIRESTRLFLVITSAPHLASLVSSLRLNGDFYGDLTAAETALPTLLRTCANIRRLPMDVSNGFKGDGDQVRRIEGMVAGLGGRLKHLKIHRPSSDPAGLDALLLPLTHLKCLKLELFLAILWEEEPPMGLNTSFHAPAFQLQHFSFRSAMELELLDRLLQSSHPTLKFLSFLWVPPAQTFYISPFAALRTLELVSSDHLRDARAIRLAFNLSGAASVCWGSASLAT